MSATNEDRDEQILRLHIAGMSERKLAARFGLAKTRIRSIIQRETTAFAKHNKLHLDAIRGKDLKDLDWAETICKQRIRHGSTEAVKDLLKIKERRAKLLGLDAPKKVEVSGTVATGLDMEQIKAQLLKPDADTIIHAITPGQHLLGGQVAESTPPGVSEQPPDQSSPETDNTPTGEPPTTAR